MPASNVCGGSVSRVCPDSSTQAPSPWPHLCRQLWNQRLRRVTRSPSPDRTRPKGESLQLACAVRYRPYDTELHHEGLQRVGRASVMSKTTHQLVRFQTGRGAQTRVQQLEDERHHHARTGTPAARNTPLDVLPIVAPPRARSRQASSPLSHHRYPSRRSPPASKHSVGWPPRTDHGLWPWPRSLCCPAENRFGHGTRGDMRIAWAVLMVEAPVST